jgi:hypothetical protein
MDATMVYRGMKNAVDVDPLVIDGVEIGYVGDYKNGEYRIASPLGLYMGTITTIRAEVNGISRSWYHADDWNGIGADFSKLAFAMCYIVSQYMLATDQPVPGI